MPEKKLVPTPFLVKINDKVPVYVANGNNAYENTVNALKNIDLSPVKGKTVLLKPNIGRMSKPHTGINTNPEVVAAAIDVFTRAGAEVVIGESPITGVKTLEAFELAGITEIAKQRNCPLIDMDERKFVDVNYEKGIAKKDFKVCPEVFEYDYIISIPVIKMHMHTGVTLSIKNMKGCLWRRSKVVLHMLEQVEGYNEKPLDIAISDMSAFLRPHLSIIDGSTCMEGMGPSAGKPRELGVVIVSADGFAADAVACRLMGTCAENIPHLNLGASRGFGEINLDNIKVFPCDWENLSQEFISSPDDISVDFDNVNILDEQSCSACQSTLMLFLKKYGDILFDYFPDETEVNIAIGKGHSNVPENTLLIGNCTIKHKNKGIFVKGCPPVGSEILMAISDKPYLGET